MPEITTLLLPPRTGAQTPDRVLKLDDAPLAYRLVRARRRTVAICIGPSGVEVRAPRATSLAEIEGFMRDKARWIRRRLAETQPGVAFRWEEGARLPILGQEVVLAAAPAQPGIALEGTTLLIGHAPPARRTCIVIGGSQDIEPVHWRAGDWRMRVLQWLRVQALDFFARRAAGFAATLGVPLPALKLSNAATQWGSCIRHGDRARVLLHWKLYLMPPALVDYVVAHELAHLRELNHSARFWAEVARVYPDPAAARRELNRRGRMLPRL